MENKYKLKKIFLNNFRNTKLLQNITFEMTFTKIEELITDIDKTKNYYNFSDSENISTLTLFDWENGYWKTTFFYALEFLLLWKINKNSNENKEGDYLKNKDSIPKNAPYFISTIFSNWTDDIQITRVSTWNNIWENIIIDWNTSEQQDVNDFFWIQDLEDYYKNYIYLPQDEVLNFIANKNDKQGLEKFFNIDTENRLLELIDNSNKKQLWKKIIKVKTEIEKKCTELKRKKSELTTSLRIENVTYQTISEKNEKFDNNFLKELESEKDLSKKIRILKRLQDDYVDYKFLLSYHNEYIFQRFKSYKEGFLQHQDFVLWENFQLYLDFDKYHKETDEEIKNKSDFHQIDHNVAKLTKAKLLNQTLLTTLKDIEKQKWNFFFDFKDWKLIKTKNTKNINTDLLKKYDESNYLDEKINLINRSINEKTEEIEQFWLLIQWIQNIHTKIQDSWFHSLEINEKGNCNQYCPVCGSDNESYDKLQWNIDTQLKYFRDKSNDTQIILNSIDDIIKSQDFIEIIEKVTRKIDNFTESIQKTEKLRDIIQQENFEGKRSDRNLNIFLKKRSDKLRISPSLSIQWIFNEIISDVDIKLSESKFEEILILNLSDYERKYKSLIFDWGNDTDFKIITHSFNVNINEMINHNETFIDNEIKNINWEINNKNIVEIDEKINYLEKRIKVLDNFSSLFKELHISLDTNINEHKKTLLSNIRLPVYIFSKRILKNHEGASIFLDTDANWKIIIYSKEFWRNPIYNYSQWQLTTVMISILLSLNLLLSNTSNLNTILIDDPIQTLDDLNQLAFINLLRYQFSDKQIILSTHEQEFSNFIRYKFWRLWLSQNNFNVKDRFLWN